MNVINNFSSSDVEAQDTIITDYEWDQDGKPVFKSVSLVKGVERSQEHAPRLRLKRKTVTIHGPDVSLLEELKTNLSRFSKAVQKPVNLIQLVRRVLDGGLASNFKCSTTGSALNRRIILDPSQRLLNLVTAMRAWNRKCQVVC